MRTPTVLGCAVVALLATSCAGTLSPPFDTLSASSVRVFRLQNYEAPSAAATPAAGGFSLPPEIAQWIKAGASMLPPGLIPPGLIPGAAPAPGAAAADATRFEGFRVLGFADVTDAAMRKELTDVFGHAANFDDAGTACPQGLYAELGISFWRGGSQPPADLLVSFSCDRVEARNFAWPHGKSGLTPDAVKRLTKVAQAAFQGKL